MLFKLVKKEVVLCMHPIVPIMFLLSAMVMIPNYPFTVIFFYTALGIFFTCLLGRENHDILYTINLPIAKSDVVKGRFALAILIELVQILFVIPFILLRQKIEPMGNQAGMDANLSLLAMGFLLYALFNFVFFTRYYKNVDKVGSSFLAASILMFVGIGIIEASVQIIPFMRDYLDTKDPQYMGYKLAVLVIAVLIYGTVNYFAYKKSITSFLKQDL